MKISKETNSISDSSIFYFRVMELLTHRSRKHEFKNFTPFLDNSANELNFVETTYLDKQITERCNSVISESTLQSNAFNSVM